MLISDRLRWCAWKKIYPNVALIRRARNLPETRFWPITVRIEYRKLSSNTLLEKREAMKKVGERNVTREEGDIVVAHELSYRKRILQNCTERGRKGKYDLRETLW